VSIEGTGNPNLIRHWFPRASALPNTFTLTKPANFASNFDPADFVNKC